MNRTAQIDTSWCDNLVRMSAQGHRVLAAQPDDERDVAQLLLEMMAASAWGGTELDIDGVLAWTRQVLSSHLWLVLLLRDGADRPRGVAVGQYISYEVDAGHRILKCKQLYVRPGTTDSCMPLSHLLVQALLTAARRSPKVRDVFLVTLGAADLARTATLLERAGFRRIGTQHLGSRTQVRAYPALKAIQSPEEMNPEILLRMQELSEAFLKESSRAALRPRLNFRGLLEYALQPREDATAVALLSFDRNRLVGFIAGRAQPVPLSRRRYLQSSFFFVEPAYRGTPIGRQLFDAFAQKAGELGLDGANLGTSSEIEVDRVCRFLHLRGYRHSGDVFAYRVDQDREDC